VKTTVLQSFRTTDVPAWLGTCLRTVRDWSATHGWHYQFLDDRFLDLAPAWARERCGRNVYALTDICRLQWIRGQLDAGYDRVVWADADLLVFAPSRLALPETGDHAFAHELFMHKHGEVVTPIAGLNNALMWFHSGSPMLDRYLERALSLLRDLPPGPVPRTALGPALLRELHADSSAQLIQGVGLITLYLAEEIVAGGGPLLRQYRQLLPAPLAAANLCHFQRNLVPQQQRAQFDALYLRAVNTLLAGGGLLPL
jgi:hypothetical protein